MLIECYAKINLMLQILDKRQDGFHELLSIIQTVSLSDRIVLSKKLSPGISFKSNSVLMPNGPANLAVRAAEVFFDEIGESGNIEIFLDKRIPVGAGLGGGSSDAAAVLKGLNTLWGEPLERECLLELSARLGSDVPFFIDGGTALARGRGEIIVPLPFIGEMPVLLINPGFPISTAEIYSKHKLHLTSSNNILNILPVLMTGEMTGIELIKHVQNDLQRTVLKLYPVIGDMLEWMDGQGADTVCVSGSGGTVFGLFVDSGMASEVAGRAKKRFPWVFLAHSVAGTH